MNDFQAGWALPALPAFFNVGCFYLFNPYPWFYS